ncbi:MAG: ABC transporter permease [Armatimonadota bacterium]|nr:ABC transporter permease [Armatimonadota bacterium]MDR7452469.1 ABC transporter permease [Armatimonadota bacterium]MDR7467321.1 ABC transporter permease [Armatimonadota bacterium]MDR7494092.1 ABC transporter permease [Armatimonadota bacterium]MDR7498941.1 ABC transporter permease [Armatimonadota bacterium]
MRTWTRVSNTSDRPAEAPLPAEGQGALPPARPRRRLRRYPVAAAALVALAAVVLVAAGADWVAPYPPLKQEIAGRLAPPSWLPGGRAGHLFGTDQLGRDILSRVIFGARISLTVAVLAVGLAASVGIVLGVVSGYYGGWADRVLARLADIQLAFPTMLLVITLIAMVGPSLVNLIAALGIGGWASYFRMARAQVLTLRETEYVLAARCVGVPDLAIAFRHVLPNALSPLIVLASFSMAQVIILESALSFLGLGVQPPTPTWGGMLSDSRDYLSLAWWLAAFPGAALTVTVLAINVLGDWLRDMLDPRLVV